MNSCSNWKLQKWLTVIGNFLIVCPIGIPFTWGNIDMYALSYIAVRGQTRTSVDAPWIVSAFYICSCCGVFLANRPRTRRLVLLLVVFMFAGGRFLTYLAVQTSVAALTTSVGVLCGLSGGVINGIALQYAGEWAGEDLGLVFGIVQGGTRIWPILMNPLFTNVVNPDNLSPSVEVNSIRLFSQQVVLNKVPLAFIGLGAISFLLQIIGTVCVRDVTVKRPEKSPLNSNSAVNPESVFKGSVDSGRKRRDISDKNLRQMITSLSFYSISAVYVLFECCLLVHVNYYKDYGAKWVHDDHFLANVGILFVAFGAVGFPLSGFVSDHIGVKKTSLC